MGELMNEINDAYASGELTFKRLTPNELLLEKEQLSRLKRKVQGAFPTCNFKWLLYKCIITNLKSRWTCEETFYESTVDASEILIDTLRSKIQFCLDSEAESVKFEKSITQKERD